MCAIAGILSLRKPRSIKKMVDVMVHRGPDGFGFYEDDTISLGHRRLSIIDVEGGQQPIANETGRLQLVCNGEIYNSPDLRQELLAKGHTFTTQTDVEVILHLYEEYGKDCVKFLRGMFAFAIWDRDHQSLFLGRDHLGQKPLFFCQTNDTFLFASEIKGILAAGLTEPKIDLDALWHYLSLRFIPDQYSLFKDIKKLPAGSWLFLENSKAAIEKYWTPNFTNKLVKTEEEILAGLDDLLRETVQMHLLSDVEVGGFLSGGIDSSLICAQMATVSGKSFPVFSVGVKEQDFNELPYARMVASQYQLDGRERVANPDIINLIPWMTYHMEEPADPYGIGMYLVSQLASESVKVVLSGDGGDENFAGYDRFLGNRLVDYYALLPLWVRKTVMKNMINRIPETFAYKSLAQKAAWVNEMSFYGTGERYARSMGFLRFSHEMKSELFTEKARSLIEDGDSAAKVLNFFEAENVDLLVDRMLYTDLMTRMPDHLLTVVDRLTMAHSLESRAPLLDYKVVEYAARIPGALKLKHGRLKYLLRQLGSRYLSPELINRKKVGFGFPLGIWMRTELKNFITNLMKASRFVELGIFDQAYINRIIQEHMTGKADHNYRIWILINLEIWYRLYFENTTPENMTNFIHSMK